MGTNYYIKGYDAPIDEQEQNDNRWSPEWHIGKRSAAGLFCFDCGLSLCLGGAKGVHQGKYEWHNECPNCGMTYKKEGLENSSAGLELGFNKDYKALKTGVSTASSFSFAMKWEDIDRNLEQKFDNDMTVKCIIDEYGREFSYTEFKDLILAIPTDLQFYYSLGQKFS